MDILCSLKSYYRDNKLISILINLFFLLVVLVYLMPFYADDDTFSYIYKIFQLDYAITGAFTLIFIMMYTFLMFDSKIVKVLYTIMVALNFLFAYFGIRMFSYSYSYEDLLLISPLILLTLFGLVYVKFKKYKCVKKYNINGLMILASVVIPLLLLNILGRLIFSFIA